MRQFKKKILRTAMRRATNARIETRDAILWSVHPDERYCLVKLQGNNTTIKAYYPENTEQKPTWLKPGNAVKIQHTAGNRNRIELVGNGQYVPTPTASSMFPETLAAIDTVLSGCKVSGHGSAMAVSIGSGTYRIDDTIYTLSALGMESDSGAVMGSFATVMGEAAIGMTVDAAHSTLFRIDIFVIGIDGIVHYVKGSASSSPVAPTVPSIHLLLASVLVPPACTAITDDLINIQFVPPFIAELQVGADPDILDWEIVDFLYVPELYSTITATVKDQYGNIIIGTNFSIQATILSGTGLIDGLYPTKIKGTGSDGIVTFIFERTDIENSGASIIMCTLLDEDDVTGMVSILQLDEPYVED